MRRSSAIGWHGTVGRTDENRAVLACSSASLFAYTMWLLPALVLIPTVSIVVYLRRRGGGLSATGGPHALAMAGSFDAHARKLLRSGRNAALLAGAYRRQVELVSEKLVVDTSTRAITLITPTLFCDLRISAGRTPKLERASSLEDLSLSDLADLARTTHCFCGSSEVVGGTVQRPVVNRAHALDWQPWPRLRPNRWTAEPRWESGGWVEWGAPDAHGQPGYIEHWLTLASSRDGPFLALRRRTASADADAYLLVAGDHFAYAVGRPGGCALPIVTPGEGGHPADRGRVEPLVERAVRAGDRRTLEAICSMAVHYGSVSGGAPCAEARRVMAPDDAPPPPRPPAGSSSSSTSTRWTVRLSSEPWREGTSLQPLVRALAWGEGGGNSGSSSGAGAALPTSVTAADGREWEVFEAVGIASEAALRALLS